jgi:hypothetical protein
MAKIGNSMRFQYKMSFILKIGKSLFNQQKKIFLTFVKP